MQQLRYGPNNFSIEVAGGFIKLAPPNQVWGQLPLDVFVSGKFPAAGESFAYPPLVLELSQNLNLGVCEFECTVAGCDLVADDGELLLDAPGLIKVRIF